LDIFFQGFFSVNAIEFLTLNLDLRCRVTSNLIVRTEEANDACRTS